MKNYIPGIIRIISFVMLFVFIVDVSEAQSRRSRGEKKVDKEQVKEKDESDAKSRTRTTRDNDSNGGRTTRAGRTTDSGAADGRGLRAQRTRDSEKASITGIITFEGKAPKMKSLRMDADPVCAANNEIAPRKEWLILDENNGVKNVLVFVTEGLNNDYSPPKESVVIDQRGCVYVPHVLGVMVGQKLDILNSDGTLHNIHALPKVNKEFNNAMPRSKKQMTVKFDKSEAPFKVKCDVHPWMGAFIGVFDHPYFAVTGDKGSYVISGLEPGEYVIEAWHEKLGSQTANITVSNSEAHQDFTFKKPSKKK